MRAHDTIEQLAKNAARDVERGALTLAQIAGLTSAELQALSDAAADLCRRGRSAEASEMLGFLVTFDPYNPKHWRRMARAQRGLGNRRLAACCSESASMLGQGAPRR